MISAKDSLISHHDTQIGHKTAWLDAPPKVEEWRAEGWGSRHCYNHYLSRGDGEENK